MRMRHCFTLIEVIITLSILAILAVNLAPKYRDVGREATIASLRGVVSQLNSRESSLWAKVKIGGRGDLAGSEGSEAKSNDEFVFNHVTELNNSASHGAISQTRVYWDTDGTYGQGQEINSLKGRYETYGGGQMPGATIYLMVTGYDNVALAVQRRSGNSDQPGFWVVVSDDVIVNSVQDWIETDK